MHGFLEIVFLRRVREKLFASIFLTYAAIFVIILGIFVRLYRFGTYPSAMYQDGAMAAVDAKALLTYGTDRFGTRLPVYLTAWKYGQMSAMMSYLMILPIKLLGMTIFASRLPMLAVSLVSLIFVYLFAKDVMGKRVALFALAFVSICPWHIITSRWALDCNLFPHFLLAGTYFLYRGIQKKRICLYASMIIYGLSMYCYGISIYSVPVLLLVSSLVLLKRKKINLKTLFVCVLVYLLFAWPFIACIFINAFGFPEIKTVLFTIPNFPVSVRSNDILFFSENPLTRLLGNIQGVLETFLQIKIGGGFAGNLVPGFGLVYLFSFPFIILGAILLLARSKKETAPLLILVWLLTAVLVGLLTTGASIFLHRFNIIFYPLTILALLGIYAFEKYLKDNNAPLSILLAIPAIYIFSFFIFSVTYFTSYQKSLDQAYMKDYKEAILSLKDDFYDKKFKNLYVEGDPRPKGIPSIAETLTLFYWDVDAKDYQSSEFSKHLHFLLPENFGTNLFNYEEETAYILLTKNTDSKELKKVPCEVEEFESMVVIKNCSVIPKT